MTTPNTASPRKRLRPICSELESSQPVKKLRHDLLLGDLSIANNPAVALHKSSTPLPIVSERPHYEYISPNLSDDELQSPAFSSSSKISRPPRPDKLILREVTHTQPTVAAQEHTITPVSTPVTVSTASSTSVPAIVTPSTPKSSSSPWYYSLLWLFMVVLSVTNFCTYGLWMQSQLELQDIAHQPSLITNESALVVIETIIAPVEVNVTKEEWQLLQKAWYDAVDELEDLQNQFDSWRERHEREAQNKQESSRREYMQRLSFLESKGYLTCVDDEGLDCDDWAGQGECGRNQVFMEFYCRKACDFCGQSLN
jgi:hypothetical protein